MTGPVEIRGFDLTLKSGLSILIQIFYQDFLDFKFFKLEIIHF